MIAGGMFEKAALEAKQMINMFEQKKKLGHRISSNEQYAESKVEYWIKMSNSSSLTLKETLQSVTNPIWELVYLWNGTCYWQYEVAVDIIHSKRQSNNRKNDDPILYLVMGVLYRDRYNNMELAMEYFNMILTMDKGAGWIIPYAMYEIAATQCIVMPKNIKSAAAVPTKRDQQQQRENMATDWVRCIETYYQQHPQDKEWECRMQLRCQLLLESCCM